RTEEEVDLRPAHYREEQVGPAIAIDIRGRDLTRGIQAADAARGLEHPATSPRSPEDRQARAGDSRGDEVRGAVAVEVRRQEEGLEAGRAERDRGIELPVAPPQVDEERRARC